MKKNILILCMLGASALTVSGQTLLKGTKFTDNWSVGINGGVTTPMTQRFLEELPPRCGY